MCNETARTTVAYFLTNWETPKTPNLIIKGPNGEFDITATMAHIEKGYGSKTKCDEKEAERRRANKELLKIRCLKVMISGADDEQEYMDVSTWLLPRKPTDLESYVYFHKAIQDEEPKE